MAHLWWRAGAAKLFILNVLLVTLEPGRLTELAGLSLALGAFIAGMLVSAETEYKHQVETDIRPFHDVLLGLFFITVGMSLDWHIVVERWLLVAVLLLVPLLFKLGAGDAARAQRWARPRACRCAPASTWRRPASSASCC